MKTRISKRYKALGFVEALIAIAVAGVASVVLMSLAVNVLNQVLRNEIDGELTERAVEGASMVKKIAANNDLSDETLFPRIDGNRGNCFGITGGTNEPEFSKTGGTFDVACTYDTGESGRDSCKNYAVNDEVFRVFCIMNDSVSETGLVVGKIVTGLSDCKLDDNRGKCKVSDYEYYLGVKTLQKD